MIKIKMIEIDEKNLTVKMAKQFPIKPWTTRWDESIKLQPQRPIICWILGKTINSEFGSWAALGLVEYASGYAWMAPLLPDDRMKQSLIDKGMWWDDLDEIPFVILK